MIDINANADLEDSARLAILLAAQAALERFELNHPVVSVLVTDDAQIRQLNARYRNMDRPTDVLSFAAREGDAIASVGKNEFLGDVVISLQKAQDQAAAYGHSLERECAFLAVHGVLHLLGYDHMNPEEESEMFSLQEEILQSIGHKR